MGRKGGGLGTTLVLALVIVVLGVLLGLGLARFGSSLPIVGPLLGEKPPRTTTGPVVVEGIQELDRGDFSKIFRLSDRMGFAIAP